MEFVQAFPIAIIDEDYEGKHAAGRHAHASRRDREGGLPHRRRRQLCRRPARNDDDLRLIVDGTLSRFYSSKEFPPLYSKWWRRAGSGAGASPPDGFGTDQACTAGVDGL